MAALGYFVDIYDLVLLNVVKRESLEYIAQLKGIDIDIKNTGIFLFNCQMAGMLIGGILLRRVSQATTTLLRLTSVVWGIAII